MTLPVVPQLQEDTLWCWAAVSSMVSVFYAQHRNTGMAFTQCQVASRTLARPCCPSPPAPPQCHFQQNMQKALSMVGHFSNRAEPSNDFSLVIAEITAGRPLCAAFQYNMGTLHYLLITGCNPQQMAIALIDSASGVLTFGPYSNLLQNNAGSWAGWIFTQ
jgi:hypothetical protein